ncbi:MAG: hypothetical protein COV75_03350 [Candidatus Omnitrophica bacterium CG11_big_fil_rev_8_21_14_0_20_63_9]|nr:MAG: hypothetical protein COV75_03350 [Candidatus Omnitrophica bacterium CG11_big_fil_rev_8_21_14_0_20_63_9]
MAPDNAIYERVKVRLKMRLVDLLDGMPSGSQATQQRQALQENLRQVLKGLPEEPRTTPLSSEEQDRVIQDVLNEVLGYGPLDRYLADPTISEIMVNGPSQIFIERDGKLQRVPETFRDANHLMAVIEKMLGSVNLTVNETSPLCDASLVDGSRINVIIPPLVLNGPVVTIRRKSRDWTMIEFKTAGALSGQAAEFLEACVKAKVNMVVSGGTSTGKTTLVAILSALIPPDERIITIENVAELELTGREHWIRLVAKGPNLQGRGEIPLRSLVKNALRMRPDRIILGEARGGEALDVVQAMHSGHDGVITVLHANTAHAALERLETLMLMSGLELPPDACRMQIASAVDLVVHLGRFADGSRRVATISQVLGSAQTGFHMEDLFTFESSGFSSDGQLRGECRYTGAKPKFLSKFQLNNVEVPSWIKQ